MQEPLAMGRRLHEQWEAAACSELDSLQILPNRSEAHQLFTTCAHIASAVARQAVLDLPPQGSQTALNADSIFALGAWRHGVVLNPFPASGLQAMRYWHERLEEACSQLLTMDNSPSDLVASTARLTALALDLTVSELLS